MVATIIRITSKVRCSREEWFNSHPPYFILRTVPVMKAPMYFNPGVLKAPINRAAHPEKKEVDIVAANQLV